MTQLDPKDKASYPPSYNHKNFLAACTAIDFILDSFSAYGKNLILFHFTHQYHIPCRYCGGPMDGPAKDKSDNRA